MLVHHHYTTATMQLEATTGVKMMQLGNDPNVYEPILEVRIRRAS